MAGVRPPKINIVVLSGRLTKDGEIFATQSGLTKLTMRLAVDQSTKTKTGEWKDDAFFLDIVAWKELAERSKDKARKGTAVVVEGRLSSRDYEKDGQKRTVFEVVANRLQFLSSAEGESFKSASPRGESMGSPSTGGDSADIEEVPF